jgi:hypothetical protein
MRNQLREALIGRAIESNLVAERAPRAGSSSDGNGDHASVDERAMPPPSSSLRLLGDELIEPEPAWKRTLYIVVAAVVLACFVYATHSFWAPAHPGVDHNGYLVGGKMLAQRFSPGMKPNEPYAFVGWMWVRCGSIRRPVIRTEKCGRCSSRRSARRWGWRPRSCSCGSSRVRSWA